MRFDWDPDKNRTNIKKHGISFEEATLVFTDKNALSIFDDIHSDIEERWITLGQIPYDKLVIVVHTYRKLNEQDLIRIISSRKATKKEMNTYFKREGK